MTGTVEDTAGIARPPAKHRRPWWAEMAILAAVSVVAALVVRTFLVQTFYIPSGSMENTLLINDQVLVNKVVHHFRAPERGEIIVFRPPSEWRLGEQEFIKRVIGVGGDRVVCCDPQGRITVNGVAVDEDYVHPGNKPSDKEFDVTVPDGRLFVLGDHRRESGDSRAHQGDGAAGTIPVGNVVGRAFATFWPMDRMRWLSEPDGWTRVPAPK